METANKHRFKPKLEQETEYQMRFHKCFLILDLNFEDNWHFLIAFIILMLKIVFIPREKVLVPLKIVRILPFSLFYFVICFKPRIKKFLEFVQII